MKKFKKGHKFTPHTLLVCLETDIYNKLNFVNALF